jgi:hypothetical protein
MKQKNQRYVSRVSLKVKAVDKSCSNCTTSSFSPFESFDAFWRLLLPLEIVVSTSGSIVLIDRSLWWLLVCNSSITSPFDCVSFSTASSEVSLAII